MVSPHFHQVFCKPREATSKWAASGPDFHGYLILDPWINKSANEPNHTGLCERSLFQSIYNKSEILQKAVT